MSVIARDAQPTAAIQRELIFPAATGGPSAVPSSIVSQFGSACAFTSGGETDRCGQSERSETSGRTEAG